MYADGNKMTNSPYGNSALYYDSENAILTTSNLHKINLYLYVDNSIYESNYSRIKVSDLKSIFTYARVYKGYHYIALYTLGTENGWYKSKILFTYSDNTPDDTPKLYFANTDGSTESPFPSLQSKRFSNISIDNNSSENLDSVQNDIVAYITVQTDSSTTTELELYNFGYTTIQNEIILKFDSSDSIDVKTIIRYVDKTPTTLNSPEQQLSIQSPDTEQWIYNTNNNTNINAYTGDSNGITIKKTQYYQISFKVKIYLVSNFDLESKIYVKYKNNNTSTGNIDSTDYTISQFHLKDNGQDQSNFITLSSTLILYALANSQLSFYVYSSMNTSTDYYSIDILELN
jgi:hypothetical protein